MKKQKRVRVIIKKERIDLDQAAFQDVTGPADDAWSHDVFEHFLIMNGIDPNTYFNSNTPQSSQEA